LEKIRAKKYSYGFKNKADFSERLDSKLIGEFNAYNILAIFGASVLTCSFSVSLFIVSLSILTGVCSGIVFFISASAHPVIKINSIRINIIFFIFQTDS